MAPAKGPERTRLPGGIAAFGMRAAEGVDLDELLAEAAHEAAHSLDVTFVKVLEYLPDERRLLVRAGTGWGEGVIGTAKIGADMESPAGYALQTGRPIIANDLDKEERFRIPQLLSDHGVRSAVNVIIKSKDYVFGVLEADSREPRPFSEEDVKFLQGYANVLSFAIQQTRLLEANAALAARQELLLQELQHRVKNNNQQLLSLIRLQLGEVTDLEAREQLQKVANRIHALSAVHEQLHDPSRPDAADLGQYLMAIASSLLSFQAEPVAEIKLETQIAQVEISTARAQAVGLILNEFLTNSFKYALNGRPGVVSIALEHDDDHATLCLSDNGPGIPEGTRPGLGLKLIDLLTQQIDGTTEWDKDGRTQLKLRFPTRGRV